MPIRRLEIPDATIVGAAIIAGVGAGWFVDVKEGVDNMVNFTEIVEPIPENVEKYNELYAIYQNMYQALNTHGVYDQFSKLQS